MSKGNAFETQLLDKIFTAASIPWDGNTQLYVALHTADPTESGVQSSSEISYTGYARVAVARSGAGWTVSGNAATNAAAITFPQCAGGSGTATHFSVGTRMTGAGELLYIGALDASLAISNGITPNFAAGDLDVTED